MFVSKAAVVGGGTMGGEIAQAIAAADIPVVVKDIDQKFVDAALDKARAVTEGQLARLVKKEKLTQEQADTRLAEVMGNVIGTTTYEEFGDVDFVIEAVPEKMEIKQAVFREIDAATPGHAILSSNTSSLSITEMGETTLRPDKVVGFHFFYPASIMPLVEVIVGEDTSQETATAAYNFAQAIKKQPIVCGEVPGFVVNKVLMATMGEIWRAQEEQGLSIKAIDEAIAGAKLAPMGPFFLTDLLGLDTVLHVAEHLNDAYGESFYVHKGLQGLVAEKKLGAKTGGEGFFKDGEQNIPGDGEPDADELVAMFSCRALIEACLLVEEGVCSVRDIDLGMMAGAGLDPRKGLLPPFWKADVEGLDKVLETMEGLEERHGDRFAPPVTLKRLVAQGRHGLSTGQGFYPYPQADEGEQTETVKVETRDGVAIAWLANLPMNSISPQVVEDLETVWNRLKDGEVGAMVIASSVPVVFSAGADIKAFTTLDEASGAELINKAHALFRDFGQARIATIAAVNSIAFGGGCELAMACDVRIAAEAAVFGQPEVKLGIIPGFGGTQRLARLVGPNKALEMNLVGDAILSEEALELGLVNRVVPDHELFETALMWGRKLAAQAPVAVAQIKSVSHKGEIDAGIEAEKGGFAAAFGSEDAKEGISAFLGKRSPKWRGGWGGGGGGPGAPRPPPRRAVALTGAGVSVPSGIPDFRTPETGLWAKVDPMEVAHIDVFERDPERFWSYYRPRFESLGDKEPNRAHEALAELERRGLIEGVITQNIDRLHRAAGSENVIEVHGSIETSSCTECGTSFGLGEMDGLFDSRGVPICSSCEGPVKPDVVLFGEMLPVEAIERATELAEGADLMLCVGSSLAVHPVAGLPQLTLGRGGRLTIVTKGETPYDEDAELKLGGEVDEELDALVAALA